RDRPPLCRRSNVLAENDEKPKAESGSPPEQKSNNKLKAKIIKRIAVALILLAVTVSVILFLRSGAVASFLSRASEATEEVVIAPRSLQFRVEATGVLRATSVQNFGGPRAIGHYWQFKVVSLAPEGKNVKKGDALINFDAQGLSEDLLRYQNELDQATKELEKTRIQIDLERQDIAAKLAAAENNYEKLKLKQAGSHLIASSRDIERDRLALEQARREVEALKEWLEWHKRSSEATYNIIQSKKARAENKVDVIRRGMELLQAKADRDGVVIYKTKWNGEKFQVGESIWSGQPIMEIPDLNTIVAEGFVPEVDIGKIRTGQNAEVTIDAFPGKFYSGKVAGMGTLIRPKSWDIPNKVLDAQITLDNLDTSIMRPGMSVKIRIETDTISDCIAVPLKSVSITAQGSKVKVKTAGGWEERTVSLGRSNGSEAVITEGLKQGERIAADFSKAK
ncbi:MAG: efflux RND transporter periplasmic adaptor subunit, partial [Acidobacteriota bacterium]